MASDISIVAYHLSAVVNTIGGRPIWTRSRNVQRCVDAVGEKEAVGPITVGGTVTRVLVGAHDLAEGVETRCQGGVPLHRSIKRGPDAVNPREATFRACSVVVKSNDLAAVVDAVDGGAVDTRLGRVHPGEDSALPHEAVQLTLSVGEVTDDLAFGVGAVDARAERNTWGVYGDEL